MTDKAVADIGCGFGRNIAHVAQNLRAADCVGVDSSPSQISRASNRYGRLPNLTFTCTDATSYLNRHPARFDVIFSVLGAVDFSDPCELLPAIARALRPAGRLVFSTAATRSDGTPASTEVKPVRVSLPLSDDTGREISRWTLDAHLWQELLTKYGLVLQSLRPIKPPAQASGPTTNVFSCRLASQSVARLPAAEDNPASILSALPTGMVAGQLPARSIHIEPTITPGTAEGDPRS
ncbi:class I SAM-dependent methyltransferase [Streptomyces sp. FXJ1.4098]|nr:class I SAM-dependent methyltransferase [Streptomyces sp. FXJ1.4098]